MVKPQNRARVGAMVRDRLAIMNNQGLSYSEIARRIHVSPATVSNWANGRTIPNNRNRRQLYELFYRASYPRTITNRVKRFVILNGNFTAGELFILPVSSGNIPTRGRVYIFTDEKYKIRRVIYARISITARILFENGDEDEKVTNIQQPLPPSASLGDRVLFDALTADWLRQIRMIGDSMKIIEYEVLKAQIHLIGFDPRE